VPGVYHPPKADIESIRDLLRGYASPRNILKELIQNAEDAGSSRMDVLFVPGKQASPLSLLRGPGLLVANNGVFKPEHYTAIFQINLGTKGTDERAIGRFGKGLKSVFAWCEAFFICAKTSADYWSENTAVDFFNPWCTWRHQEWDREFESEKPVVFSEASKSLASIYTNQDTWLGFWIPLRGQGQAKDEAGSEGLIVEGGTDQFPGEDPQFLSKLSSAFGQLAPSLVLLRSLHHIVIRRVDDEGQNLVDWEFPTDNQRIPAPDESIQMKTIEGNTILRVHGDRDRTLQYLGIAGRLKDETIHHLKSASEWPTVVNSTGIESSVKVKGVPHFATLITAEHLSDVNQSGSLDICWSVFFPVGRQPQGICTVNLKRIPLHITLNLHGFFFLDSERLRIDGLEDRFEPNNEASNKTCVKWNRVVATEGTLAHLPAALNEFAARKGLQNEQCLELSNEIQKTWIWSNFSEAICLKNVWIPLWQAGAEAWQCVTSRTPIRSIPKVDDAHELISRIPKLTSISTSTEAKVVCKLGDGSLPGIHTKTIAPWPEDLVLELLNCVELDPKKDEATAVWLNDFLNQLHDHSSLSERTIKTISRLPLIGVDDTSLSYLRVSASEWSARIESNRLFEVDPASRWLDLLSAALPDWSYVIARHTPRWFAGSSPKLCDSKAASKIVLSQARLGELVNCLNLVHQFASATERDLQIQLAMRFLMHADVNHLQDIESKLFVPSTEPDQHVWGRLIEQLLSQEGKEESWRLLRSEWAPVLSPQVQSELNILTVDAKGAWTELMGSVIAVESLEFALDQWFTSEVSTVFEGLYKAGNARQEDTIAVLRKLRLHKLLGNDSERVSVANEAGQLAEGIVLDSSNFASNLPPHLHTLWNQLISETKIVERLPVDDLAHSVQEFIFRWDEADGKTHPAVLDWNYVVRHSLGVDKPDERAPLILEALVHGDQVIRGLGQELKNVRWLPVKLGDPISPASILNIEGLEEELDQLLDHSKDGFAGIRALPEWVFSHPGVNTLRKYLPQNEEVLKALGLWLSEKPEWHLGLTKEFQTEELEQILPALEGIEHLPVASFLRKLIRLGADGHPEFTLLVQKLILPQILKPFDYAQGGKEKLKHILQRLQHHDTRKAFDAYLSQGCQDDVLDEVLPELSLVNKRGQWVSARQLIWPSTNLDLHAQLCDEQAQILAPFDKLGPIAVEVSEDDHGHTQNRLRDLGEPPDFDAAAEKLRKYLEPFTNGSIGYNLPAALVAVLGGHPKMVTLLRTLLHADLGQEPDDFISYLLGEQGDHLTPELGRIRFLVEVVQGESIEVESITTEKITVGLSAEITTLLVGNPSDLWHTYEYQFRQDTASHIVRLRGIQTPDELQDPVGVFASTIGSILLKAHCNNSPSLCPINLKETLANLLGAGQTDLRRSQIYLLDMAEARLKELGVKGVPVFDAILRKFNDARQARVDAEWLAPRAPAKAQQKRDDARELVESAKTELLSSLEAPDHEMTSLPLVDAVRRKMTDFQYSLRSIALELFQNADDAAAELEEMKKQLGLQEKSFVLRLDSPQKTLDIIHWGRPINRYEYPGFDEGPRRGFDQDLQKMLTLNFSDKGTQESGGLTIVTGRFGLGFKTVFFLCEQPQVVSGRLAFEVRGGFYPVALDHAVSQQIRGEANSWGGSGEPTAIRLSWKGHERAERVPPLLDSFREVAPLLAVFSRNIDTIIVADGESTSRWVRVKRDLTLSGRTTHIKVGNSSFLCFRCPVSSDERPATVLFQMGPSGIADLPDYLTGVWITTPTALRSDLRWALNAPFKPDAGRQLLALSNEENRKLAEELAVVWGEALVELFDEMTSDWQRFADQMQLHEQASFHSLWRQVWKQTTRSSPVVDFEDIREGGQVLSWIAWGKSIGAMSHLIRKRNAIPNELPGQYQQMVRLQEVRFNLSGLLADMANGCFKEVAKWSSTQAHFPPTQLIHTDVARFLELAVLADLMDSLTKVNLRAVLEAEIGRQFNVDHATADRIGKLFSECKAVLELNSSNAVEVSELINFLKPARFLAQDGTYQSGNGLVCPRLGSNSIDEDETLRAAFASASDVLSEDYSVEGLVFFVRARGQLAAGAATMAGWARQAKGPQLSAAFRYLVHGKLGQELANELERAWLDDQRSAPEWKNLTVIDQSEIERKFFKGFEWKFPTIDDLQSQEPKIKQEMDAVEAFVRVSKWWKVEGATKALIYSQKTYPEGFPGDLPWPGDVEWDEVSSPSPQTRWLMVFIQAAFVPLGLNVMGHDLKFSQFLLSERWLDILVNVTEKPEALLSALDEYLDKFIEKTEYHFQMRQFVAFYAVAKNLESFLLSLRESERSGDFIKAISPKENPALRNSGIDAPTLNGMFGIGSCQLLRELYRLGRLSNPSGHPLAFTPIRKVRRLCMQLFGVSELLQGNASSINIYSKLQELNHGLPWDPTFNRCFDLPFQFLAENPKLQRDVLDRELAPGSPEEEIDDEILG